MTIEFQTASGKVPEKLVKYIRDEMLKFSHMNKEISRAEVLLKEDGTIEGGNKICEIKLVVYNDDLFAHARTESYNKSAAEVISELMEMVKEQLKRKNKPQIK